MNLKSNVCVLGVFIFTFWSVLGPFLLNIGPYLVCILSWSVLINNLQHRFTTRPRDFSRGGGDEKLYYGTIIINSQVHHEKNLVVSWWALMLDADFYFL